MKKGTILGTIVGAALLAAAPFSLQWSQKTVTLSLDSADARIGRPRTPLSVAGVHRRAYRRAVYGAAALRRRVVLRGLRLSRLQLRQLRLSGLWLSVLRLRLWLWVLCLRLWLWVLCLRLPGDGHRSVYAFAGYPGYGYGGPGPPAGWRSIAPAGTEATA